MRKQFTIESFGNESFALQIDGHDIAICSRNADTPLVRSTVDEFNRAVDALQALLIANPIFIDVDAEGEVLRTRASGHLCCHCGADYDAHMNDSQFAVPHDFETASQVRGQPAP